MRRPSKHDDYEEEDKDQEESSTLKPETLAVADQHKTGETAGGGEESEVEAGKGFGKDERSVMVDNQSQEGQSD